MQADGGGGPVVQTDADGYPLTLDAGTREYLGEPDSCSVCSEETLVAYVGVWEPVPYCLRHARERAGLDQAGR